MDKIGSESAVRGPVWKAGRERLLATRGVRGEYYFLDLRPGGPSPLHLAFGGREHCGGNYRVQRESFPFLILEYVVHGEGRIRFGNGEVQPLRPGSIFTHGLGQKVTIQCAAGRTMDKHFICLGGRRAESAVRDFVPVFGLVQGWGLHSGLGEAFELILREGRSHTPYARKIGAALLAYLLAKLAEVAMAPRRSAGPGGEIFQQAKAYLDAESGNRASLLELSRRLGVAQSGLCRIFKRHQGISPYQYLLRRRMSAAAQELIHSGALIKVIAARFGYADPYHFSRVFKSVHGISPARLAQSYRAEH